MKSRISSKGQITVPVEAREALGLTAGVEVEFLVRESEIVLRKRTTGTEPVDRLYGAFAGGRSTDRLLTEMRGPGLPATERRRWRRRARRRA